MTEELIPAGLIARARGGDHDAFAELCRRLRRLRHAIAAGYSWPGAERDDIEQETRIALWSAVCSWDPAAGSSFEGFVALVLRRRLASGLTAATRRKHQPLNQARELACTDRPGRDDDHHHRPLQLVSAVASAQATIEHRAQLAAVADGFCALSARQRAAVTGVRVVGETHAEIAERLGISVKAVDNGLQHAVRKLRPALEASTTPPPVRQPSDVARDRQAWERDRRRAAIRRGIRLAVSKARRYDQLLEAFTEVEKALDAADRALGNAEQTAARLRAENRQLRRRLASAGR